MIHQSHAHAPGNRSCGFCLADGLSQHSVQPEVLLVVMSALSGKVQVRVLGLQTENRLWVLPVGPT